MHWLNWDRSLSSEVKGLFQPASIEEVIEAVQQARSVGCGLRAVGAGHSWSKLVPIDHGYLINLDLMCAPRNINVDLRHATFGAGVRLRDIGLLLERFGLAMENLGAITDQSLAGAVATGTHGTGRRYGILGNQITSLKVVDGLGQLREFDCINHPREMSALRLNLGCLGVIVEMTIQCVDSHNVEHKHFRQSFALMLENLESLYSENERVRIYWFPGTDEVFVNTMNRTEKPDDEGPVFSWFEAEILRKRLMGFLWSVGRTWPEFADELNEFQTMIGFPDGSVVGPSYEAITTPMPPLHQECEVAIPIDRSKDAIREFYRLSKEGQFEANVPSEIRFTRADDILLSPCNGGDVCFIGAYTTLKNQEDYFDQFCELMYGFGGRPHWGKIKAPDKSQTRAMYGERLDEFAHFRSEMDPDGVFLNPYLRGLFE